MRRKSIVAAAEKAFVNNTSVFFSSPRRGAWSDKKGRHGFFKRASFVARYRRNLEYSTNIVE